MPILIIFTCEIAFFSLMLGAFTGSVGLGLTLLGFAAIVIYGLIQVSYSLLPLVWGTTLLGGGTTYLWMTFLDQWLSTDFIAVFLGLLFGGFVFVLNWGLLKIYEDQEMPLK